MAESRQDEESKALKTWYKSVLDAVVKEMIRSKAVTGAAVEAAPVWAAPEEILIAQVWSAGQKDQFIWTISGEKVITDHIPGNLARTPRDVARHFSFKWQMDADRLLSLAKNKTPGTKTEEHMKDYTSKLIKQAELLYDLAEVDDVWKDLPTG